MSDFSENLKELLIYQNKNKNNIYNNCHVNSSGLSSFANGTAIPSIKNLIKLCDFFDCSADFLLGLIEEDKNKNFNKNILFDVNLFINRFNEITNYPQTSGYSIAKKIGISDSVIYHFKIGRKPSVPTLIKIAKAYDVSVDYLIGRKDVK